MYNTQNVTQGSGPMIWGFSRYIGLETQEGARKSLKSPKALAIDVLF